MSKQASLTSSMAKMFESHLEMPGNSGKGGNRLTTVGGNNFTAMDKKLNLLNEKVDKILNFQEDVMEKLGSVHQGIDGIGKGMDKLRTLPQHPEPQGAESDQRFIDSVYHSQLQAICSEILRLIKSVHKEASKQRESLEGVENVLSSMDKVVKFVAETFKNSRIVDFILKGIVPWKKDAPAELPHETKEKPEDKGAKSKHVLSSSRGVQAEIRGAVEESKKGKKSDDNNGKCDKAKGCGSPVANVNCRPPEEQRSLATETIGYSDKSSSSEIGQKDEHASTRVLNIHESPAKQDPAKNHECARDASHLAAATPPQKVWLGDSNASKHVHVTSGDTGRVTPASSYTASEILQAASRPTTPCPSISSNLQKVDVRETITVTKEQTARGPAEKGVKEQSPSLVSTEAEGKGLLPAKFKNTQSHHQDTRTDFGKEVKTVKPESKPDTQATADRNSQMRFHKSSIESKPKEVTVTVCKKSSDTREKECRKDEVSKAKSGTSTLPPSQQLDSDTKGRNTEPDALHIQNMDPDSGQCRDTVKDNERPDDTHTALGAQEAHVIDDSPPPPAPFEHRIVIIKQAAITANYSVCQDHVLGGGRFGQVHRCAETSSGLILAAKIIKVKSAKDREEVKNEINIMNQLNHANLIQLYDAFECKNSFTLIMEYVDGGELFDRLSDENYSLTELDAILFAKQICEGVYYLHQQYILHLDLKPENILCVSHTGNQIKIIDFGLARRYKPREKLKVNFGTPEFLAPEVVNYDFVSFPTDMWSIGVITYMLLSGLSPFLGDNDTETMNYIVNCNWDFNAEAFEQVSEDAKDFISQLLVKEKSCRKSAAQCLKHEWLNNLPAKAKKSKVRLKSQVQLQRYLAQRNWKKHFYVVAAANRLRKLQQMAVQTA